MWGYSEKKAIKEEADLHQTQNNGLHKQVPWLLIFNPPELWEIFFFFAIYKSLSLLYSV